MIRSLQLSASLAPALLLVGACVAQPAEPQQVASKPVVAPTPSPEPASSTTPESAPPAKPEPEPEPEPEIADSEVQERFVVDPTVPAGLIEFSQEMAQEGSLWIGPLEGNGGRPVLVYIPPGTDGARPFELVVHFHGTYSETVAKKTSDEQKKREYVGWIRLEQTIAAITELQQGGDRNVALVYPFSAGKRLEPGHTGWSNVAYDLMWMDGVQPPDYRDDFDRLHAEVVALLTEDFGVHESKLPERVLVEGHSAGGIALWNIARHGSQRVREYLFLDAGFQGWADGCYEEVQAQNPSAWLTLVITDKGMADPLAGRTPWCVDYEQDMALWRQHRRWCKTRADETVADSDWTCAELEQLADEWDETYEAWCEGMKNDMRDVEGIRVIRTKVFHKNQPRKFSGGLGLPE